LACIDVVIELFSQNWLVWDVPGGNASIFHGKGGLMATLLRIKALATTDRVIS